jgi:hypothetical protein
MSEKMRRHRVRHVEMTRNVDAGCEEVLWVEADRAGNVCEFQLAQRVVSKNGARYVRVAVIVTSRRRNGEVCVAHDEMTTYIGEEA